MTYCLNYIGELIVFTNISDQQPLIQLAGVLFDKLMKGRFVTLGQRGIVALNESEKQQFKLASALSASPKQTALFNSIPAV